MVERTHATVEVDTTRQYLNEIGRHALLNAEQEVELAMRIEAGLAAAAMLNGELERTVEASDDELAWLAESGRAAKEEMINANLRLVVHMARGYTGQGLPLLDLAQEGNLGLIKAVEKFDYTRGFRFSTHAAWWIRKDLQAVTWRQRIVALPRPVREGIAAINAAKREMLQNLGRQPSVDEIAAAIELAPERVVELMEWSKSHTSLDTPTSDGSGEALIDFLEIDNAPPNPEAVHDHQQLRENLQDIITQGLSPRDADIVLRHHGLVDGVNVSQKDLAEKHAMSVSTVATILTRGRELLQRAITDRETLEYNLATVAKYRVQSEKGTRRAANRRRASA